MNEKNERLDTSDGTMFPVVDQWLQLMNSSQIVEDLLNVDNINDEGSDDHDKESKD